MALEWSFPGFPVELDADGLNGHVRRVTLPHRKWSAEMMVIFSDLERVLSTDQLFMLGPWLRSARQRATTELVRLHNGLPDGQSPEMHMLRPGTWQVFHCRHGPPPVSGRGRVRMERPEPADAVGAARGDQGLRRQAVGRWVVGRDQQRHRKHDGI